MSVSAQKWAGDVESPTQSTKKEVYDMKKGYKYEITETEFHGGAHICYCESLRTAAERIKKGGIGCTDKGCHCGKVRVRHSDGSELSDDEFIKFADISHEIRSK